VLDAGVVAEYGTPHYLLTCDPANYSSALADFDAVSTVVEPAVSAVVELAEPESAVACYCRGMFRDLVDGLGEKRKNAILGVAKKKNFQTGHEQ
jgi:hypothetical protein